MSLYEDGERMFRAGDFVQAITALTNYIDSTPKSPSLPVALHQRARSYFKTKQYERALEDARSVIKNRPRWGLAHITAGAASAQLHQYSEAIAIYGRAIELQYDDDGDSQDPLPDARAEIRSLLQKQSAQRCLCTLHHPSSPDLISIAYNDTRKDILSASYSDGSIYLWSLRTGSLLHHRSFASSARTPADPHKNKGWLLQWCTDGNTLIAAPSSSHSYSQQNKELCIDVYSVGDTDRNALQHVAAWPVKSPVTAIKVYKKSEGDGIVFCDRHKNVYMIQDVQAAVHDPEGAGLFSSLPPTQLKGEATHLDILNTTHLSGLSSLLVAATSRAEPGICLHDTQNTSHDATQHISWESTPISFSAYLPTTHPPLLLTAHGGGGSSSSSAMASLTGRMEGRVLLWDVVSKTRGCVDGKIVAPAWSIDQLEGLPTDYDVTTVRGEYGGGTEDKTEENWTLLAIASSDGSIRVVDLTEKPQTLFSFDVESVTGSDDGGGSGGWRASALQHSAGRGTRCAFSPVGGSNSSCRKLAACGSGNVVSVREVESGEEVDVFATQHKGAIQSLQWIDGGRIATCGEDGVIKLWQVTQ